MKYTKLMMATLVVGLLTLNGCMFKHLMGDDEGMSGHEGMPMQGMMHSTDDEGDSSMNHETHGEDDDY